ncbi:MAG: hypothetical protein AB1760_00210 [Pseudomonadota bacterium]
MADNKRGVRVTVTTASGEVVDTLDNAEEWLRPAYHLPMDLEDAIEQAARIMRETKKQDA